MLDSALEWIGKELQILFKNLIEWIWELILYLFQQIIDFLGWLGSGVALLMPDFTYFCQDCIPELPNVDTSYISTGLFGFARWVLPIDFIICSVAILASCVLLYWTIGPILRWAKIVE